MITHPIVIALLIVEILGLVFVFHALLSALKIVQDWQPGVASRAQLSLERRSELVSMEGRIALVLSYMSLVLLVIAVTGILPGHVEGAMCGTGVVEATFGLISRSFVLKIMTIAVLTIWYLLDKLNRSEKTAPLAVYSSRIFLVAATVATLAAVSVFYGFFSSSTTPVDCCAALYHEVSGQEGKGATPWTKEWLPVLFVAISLGFLGLATSCIVKPVRERFGVGIPVAFGGVGILWVVVAAYSLLEVFGCYHYRVLHHSCPYCFFLSEHNSVGYPLYGAMLFTGLEAVTVPVAAGVGKQMPTLLGATDRQVRIGAIRAVLWVILFASLTLGPALYWRWQHGVWIHGF